MNFDDIKIGMRVREGDEAGEVQALDGVTELALVVWDFDNAGTWMPAHALSPEGTP